MLKALSSSFRGRLGLHIGEISASLALYRKIAVEIFRRVVSKELLQDLCQQSTSSVRGSHLWMTLKYLRAILKMGRKIAYSLLLADQTKVLQ